MGKLTELNLADNKLACLKDIKDLPSLKKLILDNNKLKAFDNFPDLPALEQLEAKNNPISKEGEVKKLRHLAKLHTLNMVECPVAEEKGDDFKREVLIDLDVLALKSINEEEVTEEDVNDAKEEKAARI